MLLLVILCAPWVRKLPTTTYTFGKWSIEVEQNLRDCFRTTDWDVLQGTHDNDTEEVVDYATDYVNSCMDIAVLVRNVCSYANNQPWNTSYIEGLLNLEEEGFKDGDPHELIRMQRELREVKEKYKRKLEQKLQNNSMKKGWMG